MSAPETVHLPPGARTAVPSPRAAAARARTRRRTLRQVLRRDWQLYSLAVLPLLFFAVFRYLPMAGNVIAFRRYHPGGSIFGDEWVGLHYVRLFLEDSTFWQVFTNSLILGGLTLLFTFPLPIVLALLLNEVRTRWLRRFVQSVSYLPHFLSIVADRFSVPPQPAGANNLLQILGEAYGTQAGFSWQSTTFKNGKFVYTGAMDEYKQMLQYINTMISEKLLDPESFTQTDDKARQKFATGQSFVISCNAQTLVNENRQDIAKIPGATVVKTRCRSGRSATPRPAPGWRAAS